jgi:hypothetical protein
MTSRPEAEQHPTRLPAAHKATRRWLLFVHQLPSTPSNLRVRTWRRLQQLGAIPVKQAVYVLPDSPSAREDYEWLKTEIKGAGGEATVFVADNVDRWSDDALVDEFRRSRQEAYTALARDVEHVLGRLGATRRRRGTRAPAVRRLLGVFRQRLVAIESVDFFGSAGRDRVMTLLNELDARAGNTRSAEVAGHSSRDARGEAYQGRLWVTRPRPGVDRMASAWLIRRFIDPRARFDFAPDREALPDQAIPFDMFGVEFSHHGEACTFETLCTVFDIQEPAVARIAAIVHDLDLKDERFGAPEGAAVGSVIDGLQLAQSDDHELLTQGITLFDALYRSFERSTRATAPRPVARPRTRSGTSKRRRG